MTDDDEEKQNGEAFKHPYNIMWSERVAGNALQTLTVNRSYTTKLLPHRQDVHTLFWVDKIYGVRKI